MSKRKIDETVTKARNARQKKARDAEAKDPETLTDPITTTEAAQDATTEDGATTKASRKGRAAQAAPVAPTEATETEPQGELVVFALRMKLEERDLLHKAAGPAKASKFARALLVAAARGDVELVTQIVRASKESAAS